MTDVSISLHTCFISNRLTAELRKAEDGKYRQALVDYAKVALSGSGSGTEAFRSAFGDIKELDTAFWRFLFAEYKKRKPGFRPKAVRDLPKVLEAAATAPAAPPVYSPIALALREDEREARFALALRRARDGSLDFAVETLDGLLEQADDERMARAQRRVTSLRELRDGWLAHLVESGTKLKIDHDGKKLLSVVDKFENGVVTFAKNRRGIDSLSVEALSLVELCDAMARAKPKFGDPLARTYALCLAGDDRWEKQLRRIDDDGGLQQDADSLPALIEIGSIADRLDRLSRTSFDSLDADACRSAIADIETCLLIDRPEVGSRLGDLRELAKRLYQSSFESMRFDDVVRGAVEELDDERVRFTYEFEDAQELEDFFPDPEYQKGFRKSLPALDAIESRIEVRKGRLVLAGATLLRFGYALEGEQRISYVFRYRKQPTTSDEYFTIMVGVCDDRNESALTNFNFGHLRANHRDSRYQVDSTEQQPDFYLGVDYELALQHDGKRFSCTIDGGNARSIEAGPLTGGDVYFFSHTTVPSELDRIVMEGKLAAGAIERARDVWVERRVEELFAE